MLTAMQNEKCRSFSDEQIETRRKIARMLSDSAINAENAVHRSDKFMAMATRTRQEYLKDLAQNHVSQTPVDSGSRLGGLTAPHYILYISYIVIGSLVSKRLPT